MVGKMISKNMSVSNIEEIIVRCVKKMYVHEKLNKIIEEKNYEKLHDF